MLYNTINVVRVIAALALIFLGLAGGPTWAIALLIVIVLTGLLWSFYVGTHGPV